MIDLIKNKFNNSPFIGFVSFLIVLLVMPLGHTLMILIETFFPNNLLFPFLVGLIGAILIFVGGNKNSNLTATWLGFFGAILIWTGWIEFAFLFWAKKINLNPLIIDSEVYTKPEYLILPSSIGILFATLIYFLLNPNTRCNFFVWLQKIFRIKFKNGISQSKKNYSTITFIETIYALWFFYVLLLILFDKNIVKQNEFITLIYLFLNLIWTIFLLFKLSKIKIIDLAFRYSIPTAIIFWNNIEILGKMNYLTEFWILPKIYGIELIILFLFFVSIASFTFIFNLKDNETK